MTINLLEFKSILSLIDKTILPLYLSPTQETVLTETWNGKTYSQIAYEHNYESEYIKSVGCNLWKLLSNAFDDQINKSNFVPFMRQKVTNFVKDKELLSLDSQIHVAPANFESKINTHWTTAPQTEYFVGREKELETLKSWSQEPQCRCIIVSGMVGCGKTILVTQLTKKIKDRFDCVIWFSLHQTPSLTKLIEYYLKIIDKTFKHQIQSRPLDLGIILPEFIDCLKKQKILLVIDGLQNILNNNKINFTYKQKFEDYGQFLRAFITTDHRSLLITTTNIKPIMLEYYSLNQVKSFYLQGFDLQTTEKFLASEENIILNEQQRLSLSENLQNNPQLLKIVISQINGLSPETNKEIIQDLSLLEGIINLLEHELSNLSDFHQEIIYWLAIFHFPVTCEQLRQNIDQYYLKVKFLSSIDYLIKRSLIIKHDVGYSLMPVMKTYLRRKLIKQALQKNNS